MSFFHLDNSCRSRCLDPHIALGQPSPHAKRRVEWYRPPTDAEVLHEFKHRVARNVAAREDAKPECALLRPQA